MEYQRATQSAQKEQSKTPSSSPPHTSLDRVTSHPLLQLQRTIGNQAVQDMLRSRNRQTDPTAQTIVEPRFGQDFSRIPIHSMQTAVPQTKLKVNQPGDIYEQEADQVVEQIMRMADPQTPVSDDQDEAKNSLMRKQSNKPGTDAATETPVVPPVVHSVLNSDGGQPLDTATRAFMEPRFGCDFSKVRVHTDEQAVESARAVNALAYTLGRNVVFGEGQYAPETTSGRRLLAHELAHVVQQRAWSYAPGEPLSISQPSEASEVEAAGVAEMPGHKVSAQATPQVQRQPKAGEFPGYSQGEAATCGAASLVTALMIWDRERKDPASPNEMVVTACNIILTHMDDNKAALINGWNDKGFKGDDTYNWAFTELTRIRDDARKPGAKILEPDYQMISLILLTLFRNAHSGGLEKEGILAIQRKLGLWTSVQSATQAQTFDDLFADPIIKDLQPGQIAQVSWYTQDKQGYPIVNPIHAFLVGRLQRGPWFLSDQGNKPPTELEATTPMELKTALLLAVQSGRASIYTGAKPMLLPQPFTGAVLLGERSGVEKQAENIILKPGDFIAEVDKTIICCGEKLYAWDFIVRSYSFADAESAFNSSSSGHGGLIVENPIGLFHVFKTNPINDEDNLKATSIDEGDSSGGFLMQKSRYYHAWLKLCPASGCKSSFFPVR